MKKQSDGICALYYRVAHREQEWPYLDNQMQKLLCYAEKQGYDNFIVYADMGASGLTLERPAMNALRTDIESERVKTIVVSGIDRIGRVNYEVMGFIKWARDNGVGIIDTNGEALTTNLDERVFEYLTVFMRGGRRR